MKMEKMGKDRKKIVKGFGIFLIFMAVCYLVSKGIYANSLPRVVGGNLRDGSISHYVESVGVLRQGQEFGIYVPQGLRVATTYAHVGEKIEEGTPLFLVDVNDLADLITEKEIEIAGLQMQLKQDSSYAKLTLQYKKQQLDRLKEIEAAQGMVTAMETGVITDMNLAVGDRTRDGAACVFAKEEDSKLLEIYLMGGDEKYVQIGDEVELTVMTSEGEETLEMPVEFLQTGDGVGVLSFYLDAAGLRMGQSVKLSFTRKSKPYDHCISTDAIYEESDGYGFVYVLEEREGFFGKEYAVRKEKVKVLDSNGGFAAIEMSGYERSREQVVISTNKELKDGDIVRLDGSVMIDE